ncbi:unnamed protein product [Lymnaea stagnalis]|uniref:NXPE C-terminal domain-containing protein n=1 Tax=Lymnaea stagnalis TaxID=6523 RepID=A0AAV2GXI9_LYMST
MRSCTKKQHLLLAATVVVMCCLWSLWRVSSNPSWRVTRMYLDQLELRGTSRGTSRDTSHVKMTAEQFLKKHNINIIELKNKVGDDESCREVADNPRAFWRSQPGQNTTFTEETDLERMVLAFRCGLLDAEYLYTPPVPDLYHFEEFYLSETPLLDILNATSETQSKVKLLNVSSQFRLDDRIVLQITVFDGHGRPRHKGGDQIRVWFTDVTQSGHSLPASVKDMGDGTYLAVASLLFTGKLKVSAVLVYAREYLRALIYLQLAMKTFRPIAAVFNNSKASECTPCYHTELVPGFNRSELCNMTEVNGSPWFCGRPVKHDLNCLEDFVGSRVVGPSSNMPVTWAEKELFRRSSGGESRILRSIPPGMEIDVATDVTGKPFSRPSASCHKVPLAETWKWLEPTGFFYKNVWHPSYCTMHTVDTDSCLRNIEVIIYGDSNGRAHYHNLLKLSKCDVIKKELTRKWHKPLLCINKKTQFTVRWEPHTNPFMNGHALAEAQSLTPTNIDIDKLPSKGRYLIILNHFFHVTTSHISSIDVMFRSIKDAISRLLKRNPDVTVVLQGPHTARIGWPNHFEAGDMLGPIIMNLQKEIFHDLLDKVLFMNAWDMTVAVDNLDFHPDTNDSIFHTMMGFVCGR